MNYWNKLVDFLIGPADGDGVRARDSKGRYKADDKSTASVNEAYKDGKKLNKFFPITHLFSSLLKSYYYYNSKLNSVK